MGVSIGTRIIDEFLAKSNQREPCKSFEETCETIGRVAFKMFLGVEADVKETGDEDKSRCSLVFPENPLNENVELPPGKNFLYSNIICGAIQGANWSEDSLAQGRRAPRSRTRCGATTRTRWKDDVRF